MVSKKGKGGSRTITENRVAVAVRQLTNWNTDGSQTEECTPRGMCVASPATIASGDIDPEDTTTAGHCAGVQGKALETKNACETAAASAATATSPRSAGGAPGTCTYSLADDSAFAAIAGLCTGLIADPLDEEEAATACEGGDGVAQLIIDTANLPTGTTCGYTGAGTCEMVRPSGQKDSLPTDNSDYNKYNTEARCNVHTP